MPGQPVQRIGCAIKEHGQHAPAPELLVQDAQIERRVIDHGDLLAGQADQVQPRQHGDFRRIGMAEPCGEPEGRTRAGRRLQPDSPTHQLDQTLADRQAEPGAAVFAGGAGIDLDEGLEQCGLAVRLNADAAVLDPELDQRALARAEVFQHVGRDHHLPLVGELDRIVHQVEQHLAQARHVAAHPAGQVVAQVHQQFQSFFTGARRADVAGFLNRRQQVERLVLEFELARFDLGKIQHIVDHAQQLVAGNAHGVHIVALLGVQRRVGQQRGHADHAVERGADFMAHGGQERRLGTGGAQGFVARGVQLGSAARHAVFQRVVGLVQGHGLRLDGCPVALELPGAVMQ